MNDYGMAEVEIENSDVIFRRASKKYQIDEDGNIKWESLGLRVHHKETSLSVVIAKLSSKEEAQVDPDKYEVYQLKAEIPRQLLLGVFHSPSKNAGAHGSIAGFFTEKKQRELAMAMKVLK